MKISFSREEKVRLQRVAVWAGALLSLGLLVHEVFGQHGLLALRRQRKEYEALQQQIQKLQQDNQELEKQVKALKSDPRAIEKLAREEMRLARPGEIIFTLPEKKPAKPDSPPPQQTK